MKFTDVPQQALRGYAAPTERGELAKKPAGTLVSVKADTKNSTNNKSVGLHLPDLVIAAVRALPGLDFDACKEILLARRIL